MNRIPLHLLCIMATLCSSGCADWFRSSDVRAPMTTGPSAVDPQQQASTIAQADTLASSGKYDAALVLFHDVLEDDPTAVPAYIGIGDVHLKVGDYAQAEPAFARAAKLEPRNFDAQYGHAVSLQMLDRLVEATRAYHRALTIEPESSKANLNLATTYLQMDQSNHAIVFAEKAVEVDPDNGPAWVNLGVAYERVERWGDAAEAYVTASERMKPTPELMTNLLNMLVRQKRYREVVNVCDTIQKLRTDAASLERKGWALFRLGDYEGSTQAYKESLVVDDTLWRAFNGLGVNALNRWLLSKDTDLEARREALDAFRASLQLNTDQQKVIGLMLKYNLQR